MTTKRKLVMENMVFDILTISYRYIDIFKGRCFRYIDNFVSMYRYFWRLIIFDVGIYNFVSMYVSIFLKIDVFDLSVVLYQYRYFWCINNFVLKVYRYFWWIYNFVSIYRYFQKLLFSIYRYRYNLKIDIFDVATINFVSMHQHFKKSMFSIYRYNWKHEIYWKNRFKKTEHKLIENRPNLLL